MAEDAGVKSLDEDKPIVSGGGAEEGPFTRMPGGRQATEETYVDLHEHCIRLGYLARWDRAAPLLAFGTLLLGAGIGAWAAGKEFASTEVLVCVSTGLAFLIGGILLRDERVKSAADLHREFEGRLALYDDDPKVQAIKKRYKQKEQEAFDITLRGLAVRAFRGYLRYRRSRLAPPPGAVG
jgi:hypothetical protein